MKPALLMAWWFAKGLIKLVAFAPVCLFLMIVALGSGHGVAMFNDWLNDFLEW